MCEKKVRSSIKFLKLHSKAFKVLFEIPKTPIHFTELNADLVLIHLKKLDLDF
jgi:hypothetical protein